MKYTYILRLTFLLVSLALTEHTHLNAQNYPMSDPDNTGGWIFNDMLSDEFEGSELDKTKWWILGENGDYRNKWKGRAPGQFAPHNVKVENGNLVLLSQWEPDFDFDSGLQDGNKYENITQSCVMSERFFKYGYMEVRCKAADAPVTSAFWGTGYHSEIDMTENYGKRPIGNPENKPLSLERKYRTNIISWNPEKASNHKNWKVEDDMKVRVAEDFFVYGFEWDRDYIKTYFNGELVRYATRQELEAKNQWVIKYPMELWLDAEVFSWYGLPTEADLKTPCEYKVDYVRIWQKEIQGPYFDALGFEGPFYFQGRSANWWANGNHPWKIKNDKAYDGEMSLRYKQTEAFGPAAYTIFGPYGSLNLPAGSNEIKMKVWIDPSTQVKKLNFKLRNPFKAFSIDISNVPNGQWEEITYKFSRAASNPSIENGDRLEIQIKKAEVTGTNNLLYIDDITFTRDNNEGVAVDRVEAFENKLYPNPAKDFVHISAPKAQNITMYNMGGAEVKSIEKTNEPFQLLLSDLKPGVYLVNLSDGKNQVTKKVQVQ